MSIMTILLLGCTGQPQHPTEPEPEAPPTESDLIAKGPPDLARFGRAMVKLSETLGVGVVRCPLLNMGRVTRVHGTPRDDLYEYGLEYLVEIGDDSIPWIVNFDSFPIEDNWVTFLATPDMTESFIRLPGRTVRFGFESPEKGGVPTCSPAETVQPRVVRGSIEPKDGTFVVGCTEESIKIAKDGTFVLDALPPCTLWVESEDAYRSEKVVVTPGEESVTLDPLALTLDDLQAADRKWTDKGQDVLRKRTLKFEDHLTHQLEALEETKQALQGDQDAQDVVTRMSTLVGAWRKMVKKIHAGLDAGGEGL